MSKVKVTVYLSQEQYDFLNKTVYDDFQKSKKISIKKDITKSRNAFIVKLIDDLIPPSEEAID
jgi:hypothetical protein